MQSTNQKSDMTPEQQQQRRNNRALSTDEVISHLRADVPEVLPYAEIVGVWVWITLPEKPSEQIRTSLKVLGFSWNRNREAWQHACGVFRPRSTHNPKWVYGAVSLVDLQESAA